GKGKGPGRRLGRGSQETLHSRYLRAAYIGNRLRSDLVPARETYDIPFTAIKGGDLGGTDLKRYNVIVLPDGQPEGYARIVGEQGVERLKNWVREGGTLVCVKGAALWASGEQVGLTATRERSAEPAPK